MKYKAIISAHIYLEEGKKEIEPFNIVHDDDEYTGIFDDIEHAVLEQIEPDFKDSDDYYFVAIVEAEFVEHRNWEGSEWDVECEVTEIKEIKDITFNQQK